MFIQSHLVHAIFTYGLKGSFLIPFAASDKLIKSIFFKKIGSISKLFTEWLVQNVQRVWDAGKPYPPILLAKNPADKSMYRCFQNSSDPFSVSGWHQCEGERYSRALTTVCTHVPNGSKTTLNCRPSFPCNKGTINSLWLFKIMHSYHLVKTYMCITSHKTKAMEI